MKKLSILFLLLLLAACNKENVQQLLPTTIAEEYPGEISNVTKIELVDGGSGARALINDVKEINALLASIKDEQLIPDDNQEGRTGYRYRLILYENKK